MHWDPEMSTLRNQEIHCNTLNNELSQLNIKNVTFQYIR